MKPAFKKAALSIAVASTLALAGCGGSSGSGSTPPPANTPPAPASSVSGAAVKGIVSNADVTAYDLDNDNADVGTATTDKNGEYEISLADNYSGGPLKIIVTPTTASKMVCDAVSSCGSVAKDDELDLPQGFSLSTITANTKGQDKVSAPVTAWTTIAAKRAEKLISEGKSTAGAAGIANAEVSLAAGFDIERTQAKSITSADISTASGDQRKAALMNAVVAEAIFKSAPAGGKADFVANLEQLSAAFEDGVFGSEDTSSEENSLKQALAAAADGVAKDPDLQSSFAKEVNSVAERQVALAKGEPLAVKDQVSQDEDDYTGDRGQKINSFKNFVADVRAWARAIEGQDSDALAAAVKVDQTTVKNIFKSTTEGQFEFAGLVVESAFEFITNNPAAVSTLIKSGGSSDVDVLTETGDKAGQVSISFADYQGGIQIQLAGAAVDSEGSELAPVNLALSTDIPVDVVANPNEAGSIDLIVSKLATQSKIAVSGTIGESLITLKDTSLNLTLSREWVASTESGLFEESDLEGQFNSRFATARFSGGMAVISADGDRFNGNVDVQLTRLSDAGAGRNAVLNSTRVALKGFSIGGLFESADGSMQFEASAALNVRNADQFDAVAWADYSQNIRPVTVEVAAADVADLKPEGDEPVIGVLSAHKYYDAWQQTGGIDSWARMYFATPGEIAQNWYNLSDVQAQGVLESLRVTLLGQFEAETLFISKVDGDLPVAAEDLITTNVLDFHSAGWVSSFHSVVEPSISEGSVYKETEAGREYIGNVYNNGNGQLIFSLQLGDLQVEKLISSLDLGNYLVDSAQDESLSINSYDSGTFAGIGYGVPVSRESFDQCVESPVSVLASYTGFVESGLSEVDAAFECASATLAYQYVDDLSVGSAEWKQLEGIGAQQFKAGFHASLQDQVALGLKKVELAFGEFAVDEPAQASLTAEFPDLESADYFLEGSISLSARAQIPELSEASVVLTLDRSSQKGGDVEANVSWNGGNYTAVVSSENFEDLQGTDVITAEFSNAEGYRLTLAGSFDENKELTNLIGDAFVKDTDIGNVEYRQGRPVITYPNGTVTEFETLF